MALLKGFPPSNLISPSVRIAEKDLSFVAPLQTGHRAGLVGFASKGPINVPTLITTSRQLHTVFGQPHPESGDPYLLYAAEQYLLVANELFIVRVGDTAPSSDEAAVTASVDVLTAGGAVEIEGNVAVSGGWVFADNVFFRWRLNGNLASKVLVLLAGTYSDPQDVVDQLNDQLSPIYDGIEFYLVGSGTSRRLAVHSTFAYGPESKIELVSVIDSLYGPGSVVGMGTLMEPAEVTGTEEEYPTRSIPDAGHYDFSDFADPVTLNIVIDGSGNVLIDNVVQEISIDNDDWTDLNDIVDYINGLIDDGDIPGGFVASVTGDSLTLTTLHSGNDAKLLVKSSSTAGDLFGFVNTTNSGDSGSPCVSAPGATYTCGIVTGSVNDDDTVCFTVYADSPGIDGNETQLVISHHDEDGEFSIQVFSYGNQVEAWGNLTKDPTSDFYVESYMSTVSEYITVVDNTDTLALPAIATAASPLQLSGGTDGIPADPTVQDSILLGSSTAMTGLQALSDPEQIDIDLIAIPGHTSTDIAQGLITFAGSTRGDCFAIIDSPFGLTPSEVVQWQNGTHPLNDDRFDSDFAALYWPWIKIRDTFNRINVWVPPSGSVLATFANNDNLGAPWFAPAGLNRGLVPNVLDTFSKPTLEEKDSMYGNRNAVNPIVNFVNSDGFYIWGQKTLQRRPTALDRVNVRRMLLHVEKRIKEVSRQFLFEPNDIALRSAFVRATKAILTEVQINRGLTDFIIKCDEELNTSDVIDRNELRARVGVQPTRAAEFIFIEFAIFRTGSFAESTEF